MSSLKCDPCDQIRDLGCFEGCGPVTLPLYAPMDGLYTIMYYYSGAWIRKEITIDAAPERIIVDNFFPENAEVIVKIIDPNGNKFKFHYLRDVLGVKNIQNPDDTCCSDCITLFKIRTQLHYEITEEVIDSILNPCESSS